MVRYDTIKEQPLHGQTGFLDQEILCGQLLGNSAGSQYIQLLHISN